MTSAQKRPVRVRLGTVASRYLAPFALSTVLIAVLNQALFSLVAPTVGPGYYLTCVGPRLAAFHEPVVSKLLPALVVAVRAERGGFGGRLADNRLPAALAGGVTVGALEAASRHLGGGAQVWVRPGVLLPVAVHAATGLLVGLSVYRAVGRRRTPADGARVVLAVTAAVALHYVWNAVVATGLAGVSC